MAKRIKKSKKLVTPKENVGENGILKLDDLTRMNLLRLQAEQRDAFSSLRLENISLDAYLQKIDPKGMVRLLETKLTQAQQRIDGLKKEYAQVLLDIENKLKIDMKNYSFDDVSGILHEIPAAPKEQ